LKRGKRPQPLGKGQKVPKADEKRPGKKKRPP